MMPSFVQILAVGLLVVLLFKSKALPRIASDVSDAMKTWTSKSIEQADTGSE